MAIHRNLIGLGFGLVRLVALAVLRTLAPVVEVGLGAATLLALASASVWALEKPLLSGPVLSLLGFAAGATLIRVVYRRLLESVA
jgi:hypothetical protein